MAFKILNSIIIDDSRNIINANAIGIGTLNPTSPLYVVGDIFSTGINTASRFVSNVAQGTAPLSVASTTKVANLNVDYLDGLDSTYFTNAGNLTGTAPGSVISQSNGLTVTGNVNISGNLSIGGTSIILNAAQLQIGDKDIILGITTDANGNDVSTDVTANHGGISIASTVGSPILNIPLQSGINSNPSTYKQFMWIKQGNYSGMGTDAWVSNYAISIGNTSSVQNGSRLTVGAGFTVFDTYLDAQGIRATNVIVSGVTTSNGVNVTTGNTYQINGTTVLSNNTLGTGVVNSSLTSVGTLGQLNVSGVSTFSGIANHTASLLGTQASFSGIVTAPTYYVGTTKVFDTVSSQIVLAGIQTIDATTKAALERELAFAPNDFDSLNVAGISTLKGTTLIGGGTSTGTSNQLLQVTGISSGAYIGGNLGLGVTNPTQKLDVSGNGNFTGTVTASGFNGNATSATYATTAGIATYATSAGISTNLKGGSGGTLVYQSATDITAFISNGTSGQILQSNGGTNPPSWVNAASASAITGLTIRDEGTIVGGASSVTQINFVGNIVSAASTAGIATITFLDYVSNSGIATSVIGGIGSVTQLQVTGVSTFTNGPVQIGSATSTGTASQPLQVTGGAYISTNLGIGVTNPSQPLDVNGNVRFRSGLYDNNNNVGAANSVLTSNGSGGFSWQPVTTSGAITGVNVSQDDTGIRYPLLASGANTSTTAQYVDATALVYNTNTNCLGIGSLTPTSKLDIIGDIKVTGIITAGDFNSTSDRKLKTNIKPIENPIEKILQINGVSFNWKETGKATMGVIAQEVEQILPELVSDTDPKTVNYNGLIGLLIECIKEQQKQIDELKISSK